MSSVNSTNSTSSSSAASTLASSASSADSIQSQFMQMLVAQLNNQDPLNPMDSAQITDQMAQISTVSGIQQLNTTLQSLLTQTAATQQDQASSLVGQTVLVDGTNIALGTNGGAAGFSLPAAVDSATVTIKDSNGNVVDTMNLGKQAAGLHTFSWDGTNSTTGSTAAAGNYTFSVTATSGGQAVTPEALQLATVNGVVAGTSGPSLDLGSAGMVSLSNVKEFF